MLKIDHLFSRTIFENNVAKINRHNLEADIGLYTYTLKVNQFADMVRKSKIEFLILIFIYIYITSIMNRLNTLLFF